ncbi:MAG: tRNA pseudouridine(55) synthase TruB [Bdellovibrionia bacterium]
MKDGALLINKHAGVSSFGIIELLQRQLRAKGVIKRKDLPKLGHGGTLDPFATGLVVVLVGRSVKLARYFLGANKAYEGVIKFGETTVPGDPTSPITETSPILPESLHALQDLAHRLTLQPYSQTPPMHSAKKLNGRPLYELAREGIEVEREPKLCHLYEFNVNSFEAPSAHISLKCSSGTYVRTLAQDLGKLMGTVALLSTLNRTASGIFSVKDAWTTDQIEEACKGDKKWDELPCWVPFDQLLAGYDRAEATLTEREEITQGKQNALFNILKRAKAPEHRSSNKKDCLAIYCLESLFAIARKEEETWSIERVFT